MPHAPQIPSRQSLSNATGGSPPATSHSLRPSSASSSVVSGSRRRARSGGSRRASPGRAGARYGADLHQGHPSSIRPLAKGHRLERRGSTSRTGVTRARRASTPPRGRPLVVAPGLAVRCLVLHSEVAATRSSRASASRHIRSPSSMKSATRPARSSSWFSSRGPRVRSVLPERLAQRRDLVDRLGQPLTTPLEPASLPQHVPEHAMEVARRAPPVEREQLLEPGLHLGPGGRASARPRPRGGVGRRPDSRRACRAG